MKYAGLASRLENDFKGIHCPRINKKTCFYPSSRLSLITQVLFVLNVDLKIEYSDLGVGLRI